ncbi:MAG: calcium-binding protein, partial [Devosia sp.]
KHNADQLRLGANIFAAIGDTLGDGEFYSKSGAHKAHDKNDHIIYDTKTGKLYYDDDGKGGHAAVHFATLEHHPTLDAGDFAIV